MANAAAKAFAAYHSAQVETLTQRDLIIRLYQGAEKFLALAQEAMRNRKIEAAHVNCVKARDIFQELAATLNFDQGAEIAQHLKELYVFIILRISEANLLKKPEKIAEILPIIVTLREAWEQVPADLANTTSIPAGNHGHALNLRS
jgi:flagellar protein FliS